MSIECLLQIDHIFNRCNSSYTNLLSPVMICLRFCGHCNLKTLVFNMLISGFKAIWIRLRLLQLSTFPRPDYSSRLTAGNMLPNSLRNRIEFTIVCRVKCWFFNKICEFLRIIYTHGSKVFPHQDISLYISYETTYFHNILMKSFLSWFSWNFHL